MNDTDVREVFEQILGDEPGYDMPVDDDIARGRSLRARLRQRRTAVGAIVTTSAVVSIVAAGTIIVPAFTEKPGNDGSTVADDRQAAMADRPAEAPTTQDDELVNDMWQAVEQQLPADVRVADGDIVTAGEAPEFVVTLERDNVEFDLSVWLQNAQPKLGELQLCEGDSQYHFCQESTDELGRWRVVASGDEGDGLAVLEDGQASVTLRWEPYTVAAPTTDVLSDTEVDALTDAVLEVGGQHAKAELLSGVDLTATKQAWPDIVTELEDALDVEALEASSEVDVTIDDAASQTGTLSSELTTASGTDVTVTIRQAARPHELCDDDDCSRQALRDGDDGTVPVDVAHTSAMTTITRWVDQRSVLTIVMRPDDDAARAADLAEGMTRVAEKIPRLGS